METALLGLLSLTIQTAVSYSLVTREHPDARSSTAAIEQPCDIQIDSPFMQ